MKQTLLRHLRILLCMLAGMGGWSMGARGQISVTTVAYNQNFDGLAKSGTSSVVPVGWVFNEAGTGANVIYTAGTGSSVTGDTYSFGGNSANDRAFGTLLSGSLISTIGAQFRNDAGSTLSTIVMAYTGEQWRLGATGREDRLDFQYSLNATSLTSGTWIDFDPLDFIAPLTNGTVGAIDGNAVGNKTIISASIIGLAIPAGSTFWIRWKDFDAIGSDDGLGIDDFSIYGIINCPISISSFVPQNGPAGTLVTINGNNFTNITNVQFNGINAAYTVISSTQITATVPAGNTTGYITVTNNTPCSASSATGFLSISTDCAYASDLIISEYVEGSSYNKAIEIVNLTGATKNLTGYKIVMYFNGSSSIGNTVNLPNFNLVNNGVYVVIPGDATDLTLISKANFTALASGWFNGNDAVVLVNPTNNNIDIIGNIGCDPGTSWTSGSYSTYDHTLVRKSTIYSGITADPPNSPCTFPSLASEWEQFPVDDYSHLGTHGASAGSPPTISLLSPQTSCAGASASFSITASGGVSPYAFVWKVLDNTGIWATVSGAQYSITNTATTSTLSISNIPVGYNNYQFYCEVTNNGNSCFKASNAAKLTVNELPSISAITNTSPFCANGTTQLTFNAAATGGTVPYTYNWAGPYTFTGASYSVTGTGAYNGTYTLTVTDNKGCTATASTVVNISTPPIRPELTPAAPCPGTTPQFTATKGSVYEFWVGGLLIQTASTNATFTPADLLVAGKDVCVRSILPAVFNGELTNTEWGNALVASVGGPATSFSNERLNALYLQAVGGYLIGGIAGNIDNNSNNAVLLFIDCAAGGSNKISDWPNRSNAPAPIQSLNSGIVFDNGFTPDYILAINQSGGVVYYDLFTIATNTKNYLGAAPNALLGFSGNSNATDYAKGFEFAFPLSNLGSITNPVQVFGMISSNSGYLSNQFLTPAGPGQGSFGSGAVNFNNEPPNPITIPLLNNTCYSEKCVTVKAAPTFTPTPTNVACNGGATGSITITVTNGTAPVQFSKDNGATFQAGTSPYTFTGLAQGTYTIVIKDADGCISSATPVTISEPAKLTAAPSATPAAACQGASISLAGNPSGGTTPYTTFAWTGPSSFASSQQNPPSFTGNPANNGIYTFTVTDSKGCTAAGSTTVIITATPDAPTISPLTFCAGTRPEFTASGGGIFEFFINGTSQGAASPNSTFTPSANLLATDQVCVKAISPFDLNNGVFEMSKWGSPLATSAGGPTSSFGADNRMDAIYMQSVQGYLFGAIAANLVDGSNNRILLFIDSKPGVGYTTLNSSSNLTGAPYWSISNLGKNGSITFDPGFEPDYILGINQANGGKIYFDLYDMINKTNTFLGDDPTPSNLVGFTQNSSSSDYTQGFEFGIPISSLGSPTGSIKVFAMIVNSPVDANTPTLISNQFLTRANAGEIDYGNGTPAIVFGNAVPNPITVPLLNSTCYSAPACANPNIITAGVVTGNQGICSGGDPAAFTQTTAATGSGTASYQWQSSTTDCITGFTDISGATLATYDPPSGLTQTTYYRRIVTYTFNLVSCTATSNCITVTVTGNGSITLTSASNTDQQVICFNESITPITYAIGGTATGATVTGLPTGVNFAYNAGVITITGTPTVTGPFTYTVNATGSCPVSKTGTITINPLPVACVIASQQIFRGSSISIGCSAVAGSTYSWTANPADPTLIPNIANPSVSPLVTTTYTLTETVTATGCKKTSSVTITVTDNLTITKTLSIVPAKPGDDMQYTITVNNLNAGNTPALNVEIKDYLPSATLFTFVSASIVPTSTAGGTLTWNSTKVPALASLPTGPFSITINGKCGSLGSINWSSYHPDSYYIMSGGGTQTLSNNASVSNATTTTPIYIASPVNKDVAQTCGPDITPDEVTGYIKSSTPSFIFYLFNLTNNGNITDKFTLSVTPNVSPSQENLSLSVQTLTGAPFPSTDWLLPGQSVSFLVKVTNPGGLPPNKVNYGLVRATSLVCGTHDESLMKTNIYGGQLPNECDLSITKTSSVNPATVGVNYTYTLGIVNSANPAENVAVYDTLPPAVTYVNATYTTTVAGAVVVLNYDPVEHVVSGLFKVGNKSELLNGQSFQITIEVTPTCTAFPSVENHADVSSATNEINELNNEVYLTTNVNSVIPPVLGIVPSAPFICSGQQVTLTASGAGSGYGYKWYDASTAGALLHTGASYTPTPSATATYYAAIFEDAPPYCEGKRTPVTVTIYTDPGVSNQPQDRIICAGGNTTFSVTATSNGPLTYQWQEDAGSGFANLTNSSIYSNVAGSTLGITGATASMNGYKYRCLVQVSNCGFNTTSNEATLTLNPTPVIPGLTTAVCSGIQFTVTPTNGVPTAATIVPSGTNYTWTAPVINPALSITGGSAQAVGQTSISQTLTNTTTAVATATYTVTPTSVVVGSCVGANFTIIVTVNPNPNITGTLAVCATKTTKLNGSGTSATPTAWVSATPAVATVDNTGLVTGVSAGSSIITYTDSNGCSRSVTVTVNALPSTSPIYHR